jgi:hypothetical protein
MPAFDTGSFPQTSRLKEKRRNVTAVVAKSFKPKVIGSKEILT